MDPSIECIEPETFSRPPCSDSPVVKSTHILWSCVARGDVILAEAGHDTADGGVTQTAQELLERKATPGFEFHTQRKRVSIRTNPVVKKSGIRFGRRSKTTPERSINTDANFENELPDRLKGVKFHLYEHYENTLIVWVFCAVYDGTKLTKSQVQSFLEKIVTITEIFRESPEWKFGGTLSAQATFAPILLQRMQEVSYLGKMALLEDRLEATQYIMQKNIELILEREEHLQALDDDATRLQEMAHVFKRNSKKVRRMKMMQDAKHGLVLGACVTAGVAIIVVPPLVALL